MKKQSKKKKTKNYELAEVVSVVSHQLKTPLSVTKGYLEALLSRDLGQLTPKQEEYLEDALTNTMRMVRLVKDLLDVSRIEHKKLDFESQRSSLKKIVTEVIKDLRPLAKAKNCTLDFKIRGKIPSLSIEPLKIKQVVINIIFNAIEYNERRGKVSVSIERKGNRVWFCCQDNGIGIAERAKKKIFTKFYRSEEALNLSPEGSGLGLFISKVIIEKSGGRMWFKSKKGEGTTFCFSLPIELK